MTTPQAQPWWRTEPHPPLGVDGKQAELTSLFGVAPDWSLVVGAKGSNTVAFELSLGFEAELFLNVEAFRQPGAVLAGALKASAQPHVQYF